MANEASAARAIVTGGAGFVGQAVVQRLLAQGTTPIVVDDLSSGSPSSEIEMLGVDLIRVDIRDTAAVAEVVAEIQPDAVFHLAARHFIPYCVANPRETLEINVIGTQSVLDALASSPETAFVFSSTADVYTPDLLPHSESADTTPDNVYGISKLMCEQLLHIEQTKSGRSLSIARLFNVIGRGETNPHVLPEIIDQALAGSTIELGNLEPRRDYIHVAEVADALVGLTQLQGRRAVLANVGSGRSIAVSALVSEVGAALDKRLEILQSEARIRPSDRPNLEANTTLLNALLPERRRRSLEEGVRDAVQWAQARRATTGAS